MGVTVSVVRLLTPWYDAVRVIVAVADGRLVLIVKFAVVPPPGIVTDGGTATSELLLESETVALG